MEYTRLSLRKQVEQAVKSYFAHPGRPGRRGGSLPRHYVGITSARPDNTSTERIELQGKAFEKKLRSIPGVRDAYVHLGRGAWQGGGEDTWVVQYKGNGEAKKLVAQMGKQYNQDGVLYLSRGKESDAAEPTEAHEISFSGFTKEEREAVDELLGGLGFGGWTWLGGGNRTTLRLVAVPQWGSPPEELRERVETFKQHIQQRGLRSEHKVVSGLYVETFNNSGMGTRTYDDIIAGK